MASFGLGNPSAQSAQEKIEPSTPWIAAADGKLPLLQSALSTLNLSVNVADENGYTLLQAAASYGQIPVLQWILNQTGMDVNAVDKEGDSAVHYAGSLNALKLLIEVGKASPKIVNNEGKTALQTKQEELNSLMDDDEEDSDSEDIVTLQQQVQYLSNLG